MEGFAGLEVAVRVSERSCNRDVSDFVPVRIVVSLFPYDLAEFPELEGAEFGMADKSGVVLPPRETPSGRMEFWIGVVARRDRNTEKVTFLGPYAHGPSGAEFLYLNWRKEGIPGEWLWRRKLPFVALSWAEMIEANAAEECFWTDATGRKGHDPRPITWVRRPA